MSKPASGVQSGVPSGPNSNGPGDERRPHAEGLGGVQVVLVAGDHHDLVGGDAQIVDGEPVDRRRRLVGARELGAEDRVEGQGGVLHQGDKRSHARVRESGGRT